MTIGGVCFLGATLWTDYRIEGYQQLAIMHARERMERLQGNHASEEAMAPLVSEAAARIHDQSRAFIASALAAVSLPPSSSPATCHTKSRSRHASPETSSTPHTRSILKNSAPRDGPL